MPISSPKVVLAPLKNDLRILVTQAPGGLTSHDGDLYYGWDFAGTDASLFGAEVLAVADGTVVFIEESVPDGGEVSGSYGDETTPRDASLGPSGALGNVVTLRHEVDGDVFFSSYLHLKQMSVPLSIGQSVGAGEIIGLVGNTGVRSGTHLHLSIGNTLGDYTNEAGQSFPAYQIAEGPVSIGILNKIDFVDSPLASGELAPGATFVSTTQPMSAGLIPTLESEVQDAAEVLAGMFLARAVYGGGSIPEQYRGNEYDNKGGIFFKEPFESPDAEDPYKYDDNYRAYLSGLKDQSWKVLSGELSSLLRRRRACHIHVWRSLCFCGGF